MQNTNELTMLNNTKEDILKEANRCLNCKKPFCKEACPINNDIPNFIRAFLDNDIELSYSILEKKTNMPAICGKICPHEKQCEGSCILNRKGKPVKIGSIENYIADLAYVKGIDKPKKTDKNMGSIAIVGSGPAGISCAYILLKEGFSVTIYEGEKMAGGILSYGIPLFRLDKKYVSREIEKIKNLGASFIFGSKVGKDIHLNDLKNNYDAVFLSTGANLKKNINIDGENLDKVIHANKFLYNYAKYLKGETKDIDITKNDNVIVIGGGNVAMDTARTAKTITDNVTVVYRRTKDEMPACLFEYEETLNDNISFIWRHSPLKFVCEDSKLIGLNTKNLDTDKEVFIPCTVALSAIGSAPSIPDNSILLNEWNFIKVSDNPFGMTNIDNVFSGGDVVHGASTVVMAMREGRKTAYSIKDYILSRK